MRFLPSLSFPLNVVVDEMDDVNDSMDDNDVVLVIGANGT